MGEDSTSESNMNMGDSNLEFQLDGIHDKVVSTSTNQEDGSIDPMDDMPLPATPPQGEALSSDTSPSNASSSASSNNIANMFRSGTPRRKPS